VGSVGGFTAAERGHDRVKALPETHARELAIQAERRRAQEVEKTWARRMARDYR
jgi:hypothetical protein